MSESESDYAIPYNDLELILAAFFGTTTHRIRTRFRKLRERSFPEDISHGTGIRIRYDLNRSLAIVAAFELNSLGLPQGTAAAIVEASWPEWSRAFLAAAASLTLIPRPSRMAATAGPLLQIGGGIVAEDSVSTLEIRTTLSIDMRELETRPIIVVDLRRVTLALFAWAKSKGPDVVEALQLQANILERVFGWSTPEVLFRGNGCDAAPEASFLDEGPYFIRATRLLESLPIIQNVTVDHCDRSRLQTLLDYLENPSPVDEWKRQLTEGSKLPQLGQLISDAAFKAGLAPINRPPAYAASLLEDSRSRALRLIKKADESTAAHAPKFKVGRDISPTTGGN